MKFVLSVFAFLTVSSAMATTVADKMTCQQAQNFGSQYRYLDYVETNWGAPSVQRVYFFPLSQCGGSQYMVRLNTRDQRSCAVGCQPNPGAEN